MKLSNNIIIGINVQNTNVEDTDNFSYLGASVSTTVELTKTLHPDLSKHVVFLET